MSLPPPASVVPGSRHLRSRRGRLYAAFGLSLVVHGLLLALEFGAAGTGLPWLRWQAQPRRVSLAPIRAQLAPAALAGDPPAAAPAVRLVAPPAPAPAKATPRRRPAAPSPPRPDRRALLQPVTPIEIPPLDTPTIAPVRTPSAAATAPRAISPAPSFAPEQVNRLTSEQPGTTPLAAAAPPPSEPGPPPPQIPSPPAPTPEAATAPSATAADAASSPADAADREAAQQRESELAVREAEVQRQRAAEAQRRQEQEAAAREAERLEFERQEAARAESARAESARAEAARAEAARAEAARAEAARIEAARAAAQAEAARQLAESAAPPRGADLARQALDAIRSGRAAPAAAPAPSRRASLLGSERVDVQLNFYGDGWRQKVERIAALNNGGLKRNRAYEPLQVTVSIRNDGSLAEVVVHNPGVERVLEEAIRRVLELAAPFAPFPPPLARQYDQVDIRRVWTYYDGRMMITND